MATFLVGTEVAYTQFSLYLALASRVVRLDLVIALQSQLYLY